MCEIVNVSKICYYITSIPNSNITTKDNNLLITYIKEVNNGKKSEQQ